MNTNVEIIFIVIIYSLFYSCNFIGKNQKTSVNGKIFFDVMDSLNEKHAFKNREIIIGRHENSNVIEFLRNDLKLEFEDDSVGPGILIKELVNYIGDSMYVNLSNLNRGYNIEWGSTNDKSYLTNEFNKQENSHKCLLYVTKTAYTKNKKMGCFYFSVGGIENPAGYVVFFVNLEDEWKIISILKKWG